jgi:glycosyltransferase involved in cell wall biosynthesis
MPNDTPPITPKARRKPHRVETAHSFLAGGTISPENAVFVSVCFEGPDMYSLAGGLGTRVAELTEALARLGYDTHLLFVGDPTLPERETLHDGHLHLVRVAQHISKKYPHGVYEGEEEKLAYYTRHVPKMIYDEIALPAFGAGKVLIAIGEDWQTAETISNLSDLLYIHDLRNQAILMWNCNSLMSLHRMDWKRLAAGAAITTVSRYMKHRLWSFGVNPLVIPNGIPSRYLEPVDPALVSATRAAVVRGHKDRLFLFKIGRFDPDKRWIMAVEAVARLRHSGHPVALVVRGGIEPHGAEVMARARQLDLTVRDVSAKRPQVEEVAGLIAAAPKADIYNLEFFVPAEFVRVCYAAADAVLANSGHEPFGLVGLEVMATGGIAFTGSTGEDYVLSFENAIALDTDDPDEVAGYLLHLHHNSVEREKIRAAGRRTAAEFTWEEAIENLTGKLDYLARKAGIALGHDTAK